MNTSLGNALNNFKQCADEAPEGTFEDAKRIKSIIGDACDTLMHEVRALGLKADACDLIFEVEASMYDYIRRSNPDATVFPTAEGFGSALNGPSR